MHEQAIIRKSIWGTVTTLSATTAEQAVFFIANVVLARLVSPEVFGSVAFGLVVVMFVANFGNTNGYRCIIRATDPLAAQRTLDVAFTLELLLAALLLAFVYFLAPAIMALLGKPQHTQVVQCLAPLLLRSPGVQPAAMLEKEFRFLRARLPAVIGQVCGGLAGIGLALCGRRVTALVAWRVVAVLGEVVALWLLASHRPRLRWDAAVAREIGRFGWPLMVSSVVIYFYWNVDYYIVGRQLGDAQLGYYWLAFQMSHYLLKAKPAINSVAFAAFTKLEEHGVREGFNALTRGTCIVYLLPMLLVLVAGNAFVTLVFGAKWAPAVPVLKVFMVLTMLRAVGGYWDPVCLRFGRTNWLLAATLYNAVFIPAFGVWAARRFGILGMGCVVLASCATTTVFIAIAVRRLIGSSMGRLLAKPVLVALALGLAYALLDHLARRWGLTGRVLAAVAFVIAYAAAFRGEMRALRSPDAVAHHGNA